MTHVDSRPVVLIGIDWADKEHFYSALEPAGKSRSGSFKQTQGDIAQWVNDWKQKFPNVQLILAIETTRGALINALMEYSEITIYPINPAALASYRKSFRHGGGKNDRTDAKVQRFVIPSLTQIVTRTSAAARAVVVWFCPP